MFPQVFNETRRINRGLLNRSPIQGEEEKQQCLPIGMEMNQTFIGALQKDSFCSRPGREIDLLQLLDTCFPAMQCGNPFRMDS